MIRTAKKKSILKSGYVKDALAERKEIFRKLWKGEKLSGVPLCIRLDLPSPYTVRETFMDGEKQLERALGNVLAEWELGDFTGAIPSMRPDVGCSCIATSFGARYYWGDSENQTPGIKDYVLKPQNEDEFENIIDTLQKIDIMESFWLLEGFKRIGRFVEAGEGMVPVSLLDAAGGLNVAADLLGMTFLLESLYVYPEAVHKLLKVIQEIYIEVIARGIDAAGGEENITSTDFLDFWFPEGRKGHVSDDVSANISPGMYDEFSGPYHDMIFKKYGPGGLHNCGPNPCAAGYVSQAYSPGCIDLNYTYSKIDLPNLKQAFGGKAFVYINWPGDCDPALWYRGLIEVTAPELLALPFFMFSGPDEAREAYPGLKVLAEEHAKMLDWYPIGGQPRSASH